MNNPTCKILLKPEVKNILRLKSDSSLQEMINAGEFPCGFRIGLRRIGWFEDEVLLWLEQRVSESRKNKTKR
ncbi:helix-turn-helix transcriptional regulator [Citrobacter sp. FP75]|uniref:helix-turn-helix transcriptional regulator n=1 Tax=Citrobacter sp. FP75 TaxID=1852949 RepID=UPI001BC92CAD|nr:AlpA family phage regulatory protein [Citrobacter sp. FP75]